MEGNENTNQGKKTRVHWVLKCLLVLVLLFITIVLGLTIWFYNFYQDVTNHMDIYNFEYIPIQKTVVYSADGVLLAELYDEDRTYIAPDMISPHMKEAIIAVEDHRFYHHRGVDFLGILRAVVKNMESNQVIQGGSTITQQLARNLFLSHERTYQRKLQEIALAIALEKKYTKEEILGMYLNHVYFGSGYYGIETAAQKYLGKPALELTLAESALLAGIPNRPSDYELHGNFSRAKERQRLVLVRMSEEGLITPRDRDNATLEEITILDRNPKNSSYYYLHPYYVSEAVKQLEEILSQQAVYTGGLVVYTTLNTKMQQEAEEICAQQVANFNRRGIRATNMALVSVVPQTGAVTALVGGVDFKTDQNNLALTPRQPGSSIKPLIYAAGLNTKTINVHSQLDAQTKQYGGYVIKGRAEGTASLQEAIRHSLNVPAAEVVNRLGFESAAKYLQLFGVTSVTANDYNYAALAMGGMFHGISPLEMASAYGVFANEGIYNKPYFIERVENSQGMVLYTHQGENRRVVSKEVAGAMHHCLKNVVTGGTGTNARLPWECAGKTGTTDRNRAMWFVGYTSNLSTAVWVGNTDNTPVYGGGSGGTIAAPAWRQYMLAVINGGYIEAPGGIVYNLPPEPPREVEIVEEEPPAPTPNNTNNTVNQPAPPVVQEPPPPQVEPEPTPVPDVPPDNSWLPQPADEQP